MATDNVEVTISGHKWAGNLCFAHQDEIKKVIASACGITTKELRVVYWPLRFPSLLTTEQKNRDVQMEVLVYPGAKFPDPDRLLLHITEEIPALRTIDLAIIVPSERQVAGNKR